MVTKDKKWIQKAKMKKGALSKELKIPIKENIPKTLLTKIVDAETGDKIKNPTKTGKKQIEVTTKLQRQANLAKTLKKFKK